MKNMKNQYVVPQAELIGVDTDIIRTSDPIKMGGVDGVGKADQIIDFGDL